MHNALKKPQFQTILASHHEGIVPLAVYPAMQYTCMQFIAGILRKLTDCTNYISLPKESVCAIITKTAIW